MSTTSVACSLPAGRKVHYKWLLGLVMVTVIALGWKYPVLGFIVPVAMSAGIIGGFLKGRWVCGNACPRGSFIDTWFSLISGEREMPGILKNTKFRWLFLSVLMGFMIIRIAQDPTEFDHWGIVFWQMCSITTIAAVGLGIRYSARSWCAICPVGTMAGTAGKDKYSLQVSASCKGCRLCENRCPMQLEIAKYRHSGQSAERDCLKCSACMNACPQQGVLGWPTQQAA
ncbi:MAG: 4Fe-4S binding protein [Desulfuromonadales bacterium]|jgi:polyferredoxin